MRAEPHSAWFAAPQLYGPARVLSFEFSSRGDRVPGVLLVGDADRRPLVLVLSDESWTPAALLPWFEAGFAVASVDLPLLASRRSPKLSARVLGSGSGRWYEAWLVQAEHDLTGAREVLGGVRGVDATSFGVCAAGSARGAAASLAASERVDAADADALASVSIPLLRDRLLR